MYDYILGTLTYKETSYVTIETGGIGYKCFIPFSSFSSFPNIGEKTQLHLSFIVREDAHLLYGFLSKQDRDLFEQLLNLSGIGPKTALSILSHYDATTFYTVIANSDIFSISKIPGIGKKTAEKLLIELKDKCKIYEKKEKVTLGEKKIDIAADAIRALNNLGYSHLQSQKAIQLLMQKEPKITDTAALITEALRTIN